MVDMIIGLAAESGGDDVATKTQAEDVVYVHDIDAVISVVCNSFFMPVTACLNQTWTNTSMKKSKR